MAAIIVLAFIVGIGAGLIAVSPFLAVILCLPLLDLLVLKIIKAIRKDK